MVLDRAFALEFAADWVAAWNSGDLERIYHRKVVVEVIEFDEQRRAIRGSAAYGVDAS